MTRPPLHAVPGPGYVDPVVRRQRFEQAHPEAVILPPAAGRWRAVVPPGLISGDSTRTTLGAWDLEALMDQLEEICPPDGEHSGDRPLPNSAHDLKVTGLGATRRR